MTTLLLLLCGIIPTEDRERLRVRSALPEVRFDFCLCPCPSIQAGAWLTSKSFRPESIGLLMYGSELDHARTLQIWWSFKDQDLPFAIGWDDRRLIFQLPVVRSKP